MMSLLFGICNYSIFDRLNVRFELYWCIYLNFNAGNSTYNFFFT